MLCAALAGIVLTLAGTPAFAAPSDISSTPLTAVASAQVKPNVMLLMDASGSMGWSHMPDDVETVTGVNSVGYKSAQCNVLYYNPATTYVLPKKPDGSLFPTPAFTAAPYAGYWSYFVAPDATDSSSTNLATAFRAYDSKTLRTTTTAADPAQAAYYYLYTGSQTPSYAAAPCTDADTGASRTATGGGSWTRTLVTGAAQQANFAVWYSYYRTRIALTKSAASLAFTPLTDSFRVGFITVEPKTASTDTAINPARYVPIADFNSAQRTTWFSKLFAQIPGGASPAREGLARVGRHYAGKQDSINTGMTGDPVQFSCQQNFTIMTTDGYWNAQTETAGGGPVQIDGVTPVGQQDGTLTTAAGNTPRPIWDGYADTTQVSEDEQVSYAYAACGSFAYLSTTQISQTTSQILQSTTQTTQSTAQILQSTRQILANTTQALKSTSQITQSTAQRMASGLQHQQSTYQIVKSTTQPTRSTSQTFKSTNQNLQSTAQMLMSTSQMQQTTTLPTKTVTVDSQYTQQNRQSTSQIVQTTSQTTKSTAQTLMATAQNLQSTVQNKQSTTQVTQTTAQKLQSTAQNVQSTTQNLQTTTTTTRSTSQTTSNTSQIQRSTSQTTATTTQVRQTSTQQKSCDARTELCQYVTPGTCTPSTYISCDTTATGPTLVASCSPVSPSSANNYLSVTCATTTVSSTPVASCTAATANSSNNYTTTACNTTTTGPTPTGACTAASASSGNNYTATTCNTATGTPMPVQSCSAVAASSGNNWTATTCGSSNTGPTAVASCTASGPTSGNSWTTTTCNPSTTSNVPVASCTPASPSGGNGYATVTCSTNNTSNVPVASCTPVSPTSANSYTTTSCSTNNSTPTPVQTCTPASGTSANNWVSTVCSNNNTGPTGVAACVPAGPTSGNQWTTTTCGTNNTTNVAVASCTASGPTSANGYTTTTCPPAATTSNVPVQNCSASSATSANSWVTTTCSTNNTAAAPAQTCANTAGTSANNWVTTTCTPVNTGPTGVQTCSASGPTALNNWVTTTCTPVNTGPTGVASCSSSSGSAGNNWVTTSCPAPIVTTNVPVASCTASAASSSNNFTTTTCPTPVTTSSVDVDSCTAVAPTSGNNFTATICNTPRVITPTTVVASCTSVAASSANGHQKTTCGTQVTNAFVTSCTPSSTVTCTAVNTGPTPVQSCTGSGPTSGNSNTTTTCTPNNTTNVPIAATCVPVAGTAPNWITTTCPAPVTTGPTPVASCTAAPADGTNNNTSTSCSTTLTGPTAAQTCAPSGATSTNSWVTTTCGSNDTTNVGVQSCSPSGATSTNSWVTTTCPAPITTSNVPVQTCTAAAAASGNNWVRTTCVDATSGPVGVQTCTAAAASASNNWVATSCADNNTGPTPVASCTPIAGSSSNAWVTTSCANPTTTNVAVQTCAPASPIASNSYVTTACSNNNLTNTPVPSCTPASASSNNAWTTTTCPTPITSGPTPVGSCTAATASSTNNYVTTTCNTVTSGPTGVAACTPIAASASNNWIATTCGSNPTTGGVQACAPSGPTSTNGYTTTTCPAPAPTTTFVASCTPTNASASNSWTATTCNTNTSIPVLQPTCTPIAASAANNWTATTCTAANAKKITYQVTKTLTTSQVSGGIVTNSLAPVVSVGATTDLTPGACYPTNLPALPTPNPAPAGGANPGPNPPAGCGAWPCITSTKNTGGSVNSLADVAQYYYVTDLRPDGIWPASISKDNVPSIGTGPEDDRVKTQHMTTFTIGLGVSGTLNYRSDYRNATATTGDFADIRTGAKAWPLWPDPALDYTSNAKAFDNYNDARSIDDFWHAAVNGRGQYFSAGNPASVVSGLSGALAGISARLSSGAAGGASNLQPVAGDNFVFLGSYVTAAWTGDVVASTFDLSTGAINAVSTWSGATQLDLATRAACDARKIYLVHPGAANNLVNFAWKTQACDARGTLVGTPQTTLDATEMGYFDATKIALLSQRPTMTTSGANDQVTPAAGANLVNFLRGQRGFEGYVADDPTKLYRARDHVLGDVVGGQPVYVKGPSNTYADSGYGAFSAANQNRAKMVYVGANDGMLHAFHAGVDVTDTLGGQEAWAIIPSTMLPNLYKLADANYKNIHQFFVDGSPIVADVRDVAANSWRTMLVGGFNAGGSGYYAVDITDPLAPKAMWEFKQTANACWDGISTSTTTDCHLGLSFGKPLVTKIKYAGYTEGRWVVLATSGYNNLRGAGLAGDGVGYLYMLDANTGAIIDKISTGAGTATTPANLGQINAYVDDATVNNSALRAYGADMLGNVWHFDVNNNEGAAGREAFLVGQAKDKNGNPQPITTRPELAELSGRPMIFVGTGRLLGTTDMTDTSVQSIYGIVDLLTGSPVYPDLRAALKPMVLTTLGAGDTAARTVACSTATADAARCRSDKGWVIDLSDTGERVNVDMQLVLTTLVVGSNVPTGDVCSSGGYSWLSYLDFATGEANGAFGSGASTGSTGTGSRSAFVSEHLSNALVVGVNVIRLPSQQFKTEGRNTVPENTATDAYLPTPPPVGKRITWREIPQ